MLHLLAVLFAAIAITCLAIAVAGMVTGRPGARLGWSIRAAAVVCFAAAVALNVAAH